MPTPLEVERSLEAFRHGSLREAISLLERGRQAVLDLTARLKAQQKLHEWAEPAARGNKNLGVVNDSPSRFGSTPAASSSDLAKAFQAYSRKLLRLDVYEQRALSRRRRAIRQLVAYSILRRPAAGT